MWEKEKSSKMGKGENFSVIHSFSPPLPIHRDVNTPDLLDEEEYDGEEEEDDEEGRVRRGKEEECDVAGDIQEEYL